MEITIVICSAKPLDFEELMVTTSQSAPSADPLDYYNHKGFYPIVVHALLTTSHIFVQENINSQNISALAS